MACLVAQQVLESASFTSVATSIWSVSSDFNNNNQTVSPSSQLKDDPDDATVLLADAALSIDDALETFLDQSWSLDSALLLNADLEDHLENPLEFPLEFSLDDSFEDMQWDCDSLDDFVQDAEEVVCQVVGDAVGEHFHQMFSSKLTLLWQYDRN